MTLVDAQEEVRKLAQTYLRMAARFRSENKDDEYLASVYRKDAKALLLVLGASEQAPIGPHHFLPARWDEAECARCGLGVDSHDLEATLRDSLTLIRGAGGA